jgi:hypothetical protein
MKQRPAVTPERPVLHKLADAVREVVAILKVGAKSYVAADRESWSRS